MSTMVPPCRCGGSWVINGSSDKPIVICGQCHNLAHPVIAGVVAKSA